MKIKDFLLMKLDIAGSIFVGLRQQRYWCRSNQMSYLKLRNLFSLEWDEAKSTGLQFARSFVSKKHKEQGWGHSVGSKYFQYYCRECNGELTPGPSGAGTNQVCETCKLNYGCLPGGLER